MRYTSMVLFVAAAILFGSSVVDGATWVPYDPDEGVPDDAVIISNDQEQGGAICRGAGTLPGWLKVNAGAAECRYVEGRDGVGRVRGDILVLVDREAPIEEDPYVAAAQAPPADVDPQQTPKYNAYLAWSSTTWEIPDRADYPESMSVGDVTGADFFKLDMCLYFINVILQRTIKAGKVDAVLDVGDLDFDPRDTQGRAGYRYTLPFRIGNTPKNEEARSAESFLWLAGVGQRDWGIVLLAR